MFCPKCGVKTEPGHNFCGQCGVRLPVAGDPPGDRPASAGTAGREQLLAMMEEVLSGHPRLSVARGRGTDLEIKSVLADANWVVGKKKVEYSACLLAREKDRTVVYWEMIKEVGSGMGIFGGFKVETYKSNGKTISGSVRETGYGPGGKVIEYDWDYSRTREILEAAARGTGWKFTTVLLKGRAMY